MFAAEEFYGLVLCNSRCPTASLPSVLLSLSPLFETSSDSAGIISPFLASAEMAGKSMSYTHDLFIKWLFSPTLSVLFNTKWEHENKSEKWEKGEKLSHFFAVWIRWEFLNLPSSGSFFLNKIFFSSTFFFFSAFYCKQWGGSRQYFRNVLC